MILLIITIRIVTSSDFNLDKPIKKLFLLDKTDKSNLQTKHYFFIIILLLLYKKKNKDKTIYRWFKLLIFSTLSKWINQKSVSKISHFLSWIINYDYIYFYWMMNFVTDLTLCCFCVKHFWCVTNLHTNFYCFIAEAWHTLY